MCLQNFRFQIKGGDSYDAVMSKPANKFSNGNFKVACRPSL